MTKRPGLKDKRTTGRFIPVPLVVLGSRQWAALPADAIKALLDLLSEFRLNNNGDLSAHWALMRSRGWRSKDRLGRALRDLEDAGFIVRTRQGGSHRPTLYGCTLFALDDCRGRLEIAPATWETAHRGLWARTPPLDRTSERTVQRRRGTSSAPVAGPKLASTPRQPVRSDERATEYAPVAGPISAESAKVRPGSRSTLKNHHLPEATPTPEATADPGADDKPTIIRTEPPWVVRKREKYLAAKVARHAAKART